MLSLGHSLIFQNLYTEFTSKVIVLLGLAQGRKITPLPLLLSGQDLDMEEELSNRCRRNQEDNTEEKVIISKGTSLLASFLDLCISDIHTKKSSLERKPKSNMKIYIIFHLISLTFSKQHWGFF